MRDGPKYHIKVSDTCSRFPLLRQTPEGDGRWKDCQFHVHSPIEECDAWFVFDGLEKVERTRCPANMVFCIASEPPDFKTYDCRWLKTFPQILTYNPRISHPGRHQSPLGIYWFVDKSYHVLSTSNIPAKTKLLSVICSSKTTTAGHRQRLQFVKQLSHLMPIDVYGRGFKPIKDKWDGLADYRYSIAIENCSYPDYWSEKIADCYLAGAVPLYFGCQNIADYFSSESFIPIDIDLARIPTTVAQLQGALNISDYDRRLPSLVESRNKILNDYNLFEMMRGWLLKTVPEGERRAIQLSPEPPLDYWKTRWLKLRRKWWR